LAVPAAAEDSSACADLPAVEFLTDDYADKSSALIVV
jgi:hypothetical protein